MLFHAVHIDRDHSLVTKGIFVMHRGIDDFPLMIFNDFPFHGNKNCKLILQSTSSRTLP